MNHREREAIERRILEMREERFQAKGSTLKEGFTKAEATTPEAKRMAAAMQRTERRQKREAFLQLVRDTMELEPICAAERVGVELSTLYGLRRLVRRRAS